MFSLTQSLVTRYAKLSALKNLIDTWLTDKKPLILEALQKQECPDKGPYLLERKEVAQGPNWKQEFAAYLSQQGCTEFQINATFKAITDRPRDICIRLEKKINPNYRKTFTIKLPA
jgi:hypothetical protein